MVALDDDGHPTPVEGLLCETEDERRREADAQVRRSNRLRERDDILEQRAVE